jgi:hypothetical protein
MVLGSYRPSFFLAPGEILVGRYRNPRPWEDCWVIFTSKSIYLVDEARVDRIPIEEIVGYESPGSKSDVTGVRVLTKGGFRFVRIAGCFGPNGNQKDAYSFIMVIRGLIPGTPVISFQDEVTEGKLT